MASLSVQIEEYLLRLLSVSPYQYIDLQRKELAEKFSCVPSQINYVLETRFTLDKGFLIESRRGGGGYLRVSRVQLNRTMPLLEALNYSVGKEISQKRGENLLYRLEEERIITRRESALMRVAVRREYYSKDKVTRDSMRANFLREALKEIIKNS